MNRINILLFMVIITTLRAESNRYNYNITAEFIDSTAIVHGIEQFTFTNNQPDTLTELYFFLYYNQFDSGYMIIDSVKQDTAALNFDQQNSLVKIYLNKPIIPDSAQTIYLWFRAGLPVIGDRWGSIGDHHILGAWYPECAVYDQYGWHVITTSDGEYYQEYADFDIHFTVADHFKLISSGTTVSIDTIRTDKQGQVKYHLKGEGIQDFLIALDPSFVILDTIYKDIPITVAILDYLAESWIDIPALTVNTLKWLDEHVGPYPYQHLAVISGFVKSGGIEYPEAVVINANIYSPSSLKHTIVHEIVHQYFFGGVGSNQTEHGWMDEGITTFLEEEICRDLNVPDSYALSWPPGVEYSNLILPEILDEYDELLYGQVFLKRNYHPVSEYFLDWDRKSGYYAHYSKPRLIMSQLKHLLGDSLFYHALKVYYEKNMHSHPYPEDFIKSFSQTTGQDLNYYFKSMFNSHHWPDIEITDVRKIGSVGDEFHYKITFKRNSPVHIPFKVNIVTESDTTIKVVRTSFSEHQRYEAFWPPDKNEFELHVIVPTAVRRVFLDPRTVLMDINWANNQYPKPHIPLVILNHQSYRQYVFPGIYTMSLRPHLTFDDVYKWQPGFGLSTYSFFNKELSSNFNISLKTGKVIHQHTWYYNYHTREEKEYYLGMDAAQLPLVEEIMVNHSIDSWSDKSVTKWKISAGYTGVPEKNRYLPTTSNRGINRVVIEGIRKNYPYRYYYQHGTELGWHLELETGKQLRSAASLYSKKETIWNVLWNLAAGIHIVYQDAALQPVSRYSQGGVQMLDYLKHPYTDLPGIIPAGLFRNHHVTISSPIGYIGDPSGLNHKWGLWQVSSISHEQINRWCSPLFLDKVYRAELNIWLQHFQRWNNVQKWHWSQLQSDVGISFKITNFILFSRIPGISFHLPLLSYQETSWEKALDQWKIELTLKKEW